LESIKGSDKNNISMFDSVSLAKSAKDTSLNIDILFLSSLLWIISFLNKNQLHLPQRLLTEFLNTYELDIITLYILRL